MSSASGGGESLGRAAEPSDSVRPTAFANGSMLAGKYLIEETIAEGGVGIIASAMHVTLQQRVAIKYLKPKALQNPSLIERFVREGRLAAQIRSDHVVRVHDVGVLPSGVPFMVMEYLLGHDLGVVVEKGSSPVAVAVDYVLQACDALAEAHALQIVHRDIKPANLFLAQRPSNTPILKIIDFGISKTIPQRTPTGALARETEDGDRFGTPLYMSPEQLRSTSNVDARADIWALGVVLHELLTGELPFEGDDLPQLVASILVRPPIALTAAIRGAPIELEAIILKCLEKDRLRRFRNVAELAQELVPFGPPDAGARAARIGAVVRSAGSSIRPPTPMPGTMKIQPMPVFLAPVASANSANTTMDPVAPDVFGWRPFAVGAVLAALVCSGAFTVVTLVRHADNGVVDSRSTDPVRASNREIPAPVATGQMIAAPPEPSPPMPAEPPRADTPSRTEGVATTAAREKLAAPPKASRPVAASALPESPALPESSARAVAPPAARPSGRSEFGERE